MDKTNDERLLDILKDMTAVLKNQKEKIELLEKKVDALKVQITSLEWKQNPNSKYYNNY